MDKNILKSEIKNLILEMGFHLLKSGLTYKQITPQEIPECVEIFELDDAVTWLRKIHDGPYQDVVDYYKTMPSHFWDNCEFNNVYDLDEIKGIKLLRKKLKEAWRSDPPSILFKAKAGHAKKRIVFNEKGN